MGARQFLGEPVGQRSRGRDAHRAALEVVLGLHRAVLGHHHHDGAGPVGHRRNGEHRRALDLEGDGGATAERKIDGIGGERLHQPRIAAEIGDLKIDAVRLEDAGGDTDIGRHEGEVLRLGLANADGDLRLRRDAARQDTARQDTERQDTARQDDPRGSGERACRAGFQTIPRHRDFPSRHCLPAHCLPAIACLRTNASFCGRLIVSDAAGKAAVR